MKLAPEPSQSRNLGTISRLIGACSYVFSTEIMKSRSLIIGSAWGLTLVVAYLIGSGGEQPVDPTTAEQARPGTSRKSDRGTAHRSSEGNARHLSAAASEGLRLVGQLPAREAVAALARLEDPISRVQGFLTLAESLSPEEFEGVVADFRALDITNSRFTEYGILLHAWGQADPQGALAYTLENTGTNFARQTVLASWASYDPNAAIAAAHANFEGDGANPLVVGVIRGLAREDLNRATGLMQDLPRSRERGEALESLLPILLADGVESALTWSDGITDESLRGATVANIARHISEEDPQRAAELALSLPDTDSQLRALDDITASWAEQDLDAAIAFTEGLDATLQGEAVEGVIRELASNDPVQASEWMESLAADGVNLDGAIGRFVWTTNSKEPELAASWIGQMSSEKESERYYHRFLGHWQSRDADAANAWMESNELPESVKRRFTPKPEADQ